MKKVLITGVTGAVGYYMARRLYCELDVELHGVGRKSEPGSVKKYLDSYEWFYMASGIKKYLSTVQPDIVFHLAGIANVRLSFSDPGIFLESNIAATLNLLQAIAETKLHSRVVIISTPEVYGNVPKELNPIKEDLPFDPVNLYAVTKCAQELYAKCFAKIYGLDVVITRAFGYINPRRPDLVATSIARQLVNDKKVQHGDLSPIRTFCDVRDIVEGYWLAATQGESGGVYNIGSEEPCSVQRVADILADIVDTDCEWREIAQLKRPTDSFYVVPDCSKFREATGWKPKIPLRESLEWLVSEVKCS